MEYSIINSISSARVPPGNSSATRMCFTKASVLPVRYLAKFCGLVVMKATQRDLPHCAAGRGWQRSFHKEQSEARRLPGKKENSVIATIQIPLNA